MAPVGRPRLRLQIRTFLKALTPAPDFDETVDTDYEQAADVSYDEAPQARYDDAVGPDYDTDFTNPTSEEGSQEHRPRKQK